jgi:hypothetical protein
MTPSTEPKSCPAPLQDMPTHIEKTMINPLYMGVLGGRQGCNVKKFENFKVRDLLEVRNVLS